MFDKLQPAWSCDVEKYTVPFYNAAFASTLFLATLEIYRVQTYKYTDTHTQIHN